MVAYKSAACFEWSVEPFVRVDGEGVCFAEGGERFGRVRQGGGESSVGSVDVEPEIELAGDGGEFGDGIDGTGADGAGWYR